MQRPIQFTSQTGVVPVQQMSGRMERSLAPGELSRVAPRQVTIPWPPFPKRLPLLGLPRTQRFWERTSYQARVPGGPLNGPLMSEVIQPP
jgi:hypothetical protein